LLSPDGHAAVGDLDHHPAPGADEMVVLVAGAWDIRMLASREIQALEYLELSGQSECPKQRRAAGTDPTLACHDLEIRCRDGTGPAR
jgi:hypothetical protein